ncbi:MAG: type II toxin-antitoxin system VapC family toxin [Cyanomargarita calcarea GSE-NOS-MK-12-04C]|jgi:PIN domain nuclease of toxin-antitoxin system|uniref:Type II toxin-antitoxin system VapC family toxin n=1 Tax=Cyanomargarita calcarea GSE-NOS-MK-12-04C TaxID=2839659 RepID=A0A951QJN4_9CYAN|nr:type II toxin-antitoxin system VapC family toxin [Cyanomargarita calcarea GSE-NOS-MK-12-04C]
MKLLLDSHVLIWWASSSEKLSERVYSLIHDTNNTLLFSIASIWEIQIKLHLGKLNLNSSLPVLIENQQRVNNLQLLPIELAHIWGLTNLPNHHRDPFDRLLISQAIVEKIPLVSIDSVFDNYPIQRLW